MQESRRAEFSLPHNTGQKDTECDREAVWYRGSYDLSVLFEKDLCHDDGFLKQFRQKMACAD